LHNRLRVNRVQSGDRNPVLYMMMATVGVVMAFLASTYYWYAIGERIAAAGLASATDSALSVKDLSSAVGEYASLQELARAAVDAQAKGKPADAQALTRSLHTLRADLDHYVALPPFPAESSIQIETFKTLRNFEAATSQLTRRLDEGNALGAKKALSESVLPIGDRLNGDLQRLVIFNADQQYWWAHTIDEQRRRAGSVLYMFNAVTLLLALLLLLLTVRVTRIQWRLIEEREQGAQDRAREQARFSERLERLSSASVLVWQATASTWERETMLRSAVDQARALMGADYAAVGIGGDDEHPFNAWVFSGTRASATELVGPPPRPRGLLGAVVQGRGVLRISDASRSPDALGLPPGYPSIGPFLGIPITEGDAAVAHLYLARRPGREPFDDQDERIVRLLSTFVATALSHVNLNGELRTAVLQREEMMSIISHDLKSPLNVIALSAERIRRLGAAREHTSELGVVGDRIARTADRMGRLIANLVDLSLVESRALRVKRAPQMVDAMVAEAVELLTPLAREKSLELRAAVEEVPTVLCESDLIVRVLWNLISNSIKFTEPGGTVTVSAKPVESAVCLVVQDTGMGIAAEQVPHIFERFWQAQKDHRGAGLGLYICKGIVEAHGGQIGVKSELGVGTTIWFTLPAQRPLEVRPNG
jgi:signal transduction histidine kinase